VTDSKPDHLPTFNGDGNLPPGDYWPSATDFEKRFVNVVGSSTRARIYIGFNRHRGKLLNEGVALAAPCLLDGSFTTSKSHPGDIDLVVEVEEAALSKSTRLQQLLSGPGAKADFSCDAYPLIVYDASHPNFKSVTEAGRAYWNKWFGTDRRGNSKGRLWSTAGGFR